MTSTLHRRAFLATSTLAIPALALGSTSAIANSTTSSTIDGSQFSTYMEQANKFLKSMRSPMRTLENEAEWEDAAFYANQVTILLAQCIELAEQAHIPEHLQAKYADNKAHFTRDLRLQLADCASETIALSKALWSKDQDAAKAHYKTIKGMKKTGHEEFTGD